MNQKNSQCPKILKMEILVSNIGQQTSSRNWSSSCVLWRISSYQGVFYGAKTISWLPKLTDTWETYTKANIHSQYLDSATTRGQAGSVRRLRIQTKKLNGWLKTTLMIQIKKRQIPHKGDTKSLDMCGQWHQQKNPYMYIDIFIYFFFSCQVSGVRCHVSPTPAATATDTPPSNSPSMHSRMLLLILTQTHQQ